jgi:D-hexose-6-phosphate mutarotase
MPAHKVAQITRCAVHRGGVPVCWPQFNDMGPGQAHGFARNTQFKVAETFGSRVTLELTPDMLTQEQRDKFPHDFVLRVTVAVSDDHGGSLTQVVSLSCSRSAVLQFDLLSCLRSSRRR